MRRFLVFFFIVISLFAKEDPFQLIPSSADEVASLFANVDSLIGHCVSPLSGQLCLRSTDLFVKGAQNLTFHRIYLPPNLSSPIPLHGEMEQYLQEKEFLLKMQETYRGWVFSPQIYLQRDLFKTLISDENGAVITFGPNGDMAFQHGVSNIANDIPGGQFNIRNIRINGTKVSFPDGLVRIYKPTIGSISVLEKEILPNGKVICYFFDGLKLTRIESRDPTEQAIYASIAIESEAHSLPYSFRNHLKEKKCRSDENKQVGSTIKIEGNKAQEFLIKKVTDSTGTVATYAYDPIKRNRQIRKKCGTFEYDFTFPSHLKDSSTPTYRCENLGYQNFCLHSYSNRDCTFQCSYEGNRVKTLSFPVGTHDGMEVIYTMTYDPPIAGQKGGKTTIKRVDGVQIEYQFSKELLPESIQFFGSDGKLQKQKLYCWYDNHWLKSLEWKDGEGHVFYRRSYENYDSFGNPRTEKFSGDLTGDGKWEETEIKREYSQDNRNLLIREQNEEGKVILYEYLNGTNLPIHQFVLKNDKILMREFWEYDKFLNLQEKIVDDGNSKNKQILDGVTQRTITRHHLRQGQPFLHMPERIEALYWDGKKECLLKMTQLEYDKWGNVKEERVYGADKKFAYKITREYDEQGNLLSETNPLGYTATATYNPKGECATKTNFSNRLKTDKGYDKQGRLKILEEIDLKNNAKHTTTFAYTKLDLCEKKVDYLENSTFYDYDSISGELKWTQGPTLLSFDNQAQSVSSSSTFDCLGLRLEWIDANGHLTKYKYNAYGAPVEILHPNGSKETFRYYKNGNLKSHTDRNGLVIDYVYDIFQRVEKNSYSVKEKPIGKESYVYGTFQLKRYTDKEDHVTEYSYDGAGRKIGERTSGQTITFSYDPLGMIETVNKEDILFKHYKNDFLGQLIEERITDKSGNILHKIGYSWDADGNQTAMTKYPHNQPATSNYKYDPFGRLTEFRDQLGFATITAYDETQKNALNQRVLKTISTDPNRIVTTKTQDAYGRDSHLQIGSSYTEARTYNPIGNLLQIKEGSLLTRYTYNNQGLVETLTRAYGSIDARTTRYSYTTGGHLNTKTLPDGTVLTYTFTPLGHPFTITSSNGSINQTFKYNLNGILLKATDSVHTIERDIDAFGNILKETVDKLSLIKTYDKLNRLETMLLPDGSSILYTYDPLHLKTVTRISAKNEKLYAHSYNQYDLSGNLLQESLIYGLGINSHTWNPNGTITTIKNPYFEQTLDYDPGARIRSISSDGSYIYNELSEIIQEKLLQNTITYNYDSHYNRTQKNELFLSHNLLDEPTHLLHDLNGNLKKNGPFRYKHDALNRLVEATNDQVHITFVYDALDRCIGKTVNGKQEFYLYHGREELGAFNSDGTCKDLKIPGLNQKPIALELQGQVLAPVLDYRGNVRKLVNPTAQIAQSTNYTGFGEELTSVTAPINPWRYSAKRFDPDLGLYYFGKRFYSPVLGRWLTTDPAEFVDGTNLYSYLFNDPLNYFDPDGRFAFALFGLTWGGAGAAASIPILSNPLGWAIGSILITGLAIHWTTNKLIESDKISPTTGTAINTALSGLAGSMIQLFPSFDYSPTTGISMRYGDFATLYRKHEKGTDTSIKEDKEHKKPKPNISGKEGAKDVPSWAKGNKPYKDESGKEFAKRLMDEKYGPGNYETGPTSPFNQIKKWGDRSWE